MAVEVFGNIPATTVSSGGTDAPASGTQQTWTVASSTGFPAVSSSATPPTQIHIADVSLNSEIIAVTNISGTTWTVIRGAESTTPVSHAAGFTIYQVVSAGGYAQLRSLTWLNVVTQFGADNTGSADCTSAIQAAANALPAAGGVVYLPAGTYKVASTITISKAGVYLQGAGQLATVINYTGSGDCIRMYSTQDYTHGWGGGVKGLIIDGTGASAGACGAHIGDIYQIQSDFGARKFQGTGSKGIWFDNQYFWAEDMYGHLFVQQNTTNLTFDNSANQSGTATGSYARANLTVVLDAKGVGDGLILKNGAQYYGGVLNFTGNMDYSSSATKHWAVTVAAPAGFSYTATNASPCVFTASGMYYGNGTNVFLTGGSPPTGFTNGTSYYVVNTNIGAGTFQLSATSGGSAINSTSTGSGTVNTFQATLLESSVVNINVECNATNGNPQPGTINFTSATSSAGLNYITRCAGVIDFSVASGFATAANPTGNFFFDGPVYGDANLWRSWELGATGYFNGSLASNSTIQSRGVTRSVVNTTTAITGMKLQSGPSPSDSQFIVIENNGTGSITFAASGTSLVKNGTACVIPPNTAMGFQWRPDQGNWYALGGAVQLDTTAADIQADGAQAAGSTGLGADAGHVHPALTGGYQRMGTVIGWTCPSVLAQASQILTSAGVLFMWAIEIPVAATTSNFNMFVTTAGNTLANVFAALVNTSGTIVAQTANRAADAALTSNATLWTAPWSSSFAAPAGEYYGCLLIGSATTMPTFTSGTDRAASLTNIGCTAGAVNLRAATTGSGLTSLPASPITMSGINSSQHCLWAALT